MEPDQSPTRALARQVYAEFARIGTALSSDRRLMMIDLLAQRPMYVDQLASEVGMSVANVSQHLQALRSAKLVESKREGNRVLYRLTDESVLSLWLTLRSFAETHLPEVPQLKRNYAIPGVDEEMSREDIDNALASGTIVLVDVRPALEFRHGHLPGAIALPLSELADYMDELPRDKRIVAYCRGAYCMEADQAVALLKRNGFDAVRLEGGWPEWVSEDRPTA
jgi:rhodanese-related sulfurtransferase/biotin operon repressor